MKKRTYSRPSPSVSTVKKSHAIIDGEHRYRDLPRRGCLSVDELPRLLDEQSD